MGGMARVELEGEKERVSEYVRVSVFVFVYLFGREGKRGRRATNATPQTISQLVRRVPWGDRPLYRITP